MTLSTDPLPRRQFADVGVGLRAQHFQDIVANPPDIPWFEILADNYLTAGGPALRYLDDIVQQYPVAMHSVAMSLGSTDELNWDYLGQLKQLMQRVEPVVVSDHLCWVSVQQEYLHELMPLPYNEVAVNHVAERIARVQDFFGRQILIENLSSYFTYSQSTMTEWEFYVAVAEQADCLMLLDINNIYVSSRNHQFDPETYLNYIPPERVRQCHLAGFEDRGDYLLDTHGEPIHAPVWALYEKAMQRFGPKPTLIEWDNNIPELPVLLAEAQHAQKIIDEITARGST